MVDEFEEIECHKCLSTNLKFVKYEMCNKVKILRKQCFDCGCLHTRNYKKKRVKDFDSLMDMDDDLRNKFYHNQRNKKVIKDLFYYYAQEHFYRQKKYYNEVYLNSEEWENKRDLIMNFYHYKCQKCNSLATDVHHKTYKNIFKEKFEDLIPLCRSCHKKEHEKKDG